MSLVWIGLDWIGFIEKHSCSHACMLGCFWFDSPGAGAFLKEDFIRGRGRFFKGVFGCEFYKGILFSPQEN